MPCISVLTRIPTPPSPLSPQAEHLMDSELSLGFSIQVGARFDCPGQFSVTLVLLEEETNDVARVAQVGLSGNE